MPTPYVRVNRHRGDFQAPSMSEYGKETLEGIALSVRASIREAFGIAGMRAWDDLNPDFVEDMTATLLEVRAEGAWDQHCFGVIVRSQEAWQRTGDILTELLRAPANESPKDMAVRVLAAYAGVEGPDVDRLLETPSTSSQL